MRVLGAALTSVVQNVVVSGPVEQRQLWTGAVREVMRVLGAR